MSLFIVQIVQKYRKAAEDALKLNLSFESYQMTSRLCQFILLPLSGLEELWSNFFNGKVCTLVKINFAYKLPPKL